MSIAASAVVVPSRRLRALVAAFGLCNLGAAFALAVALSERFLLAPFSAAFFLAAAAALLHAAARKRKTLRIDVSGLGDLRLTVQQDLRTNDAECDPATGPVFLSPGSTVWPHLMVLLLRSEGGALTVLPVLRDSVTAQQFRALSVAVRAAGDGGPAVRDAPSSTSGVPGSGAPYRPFTGT
jgi:toxin CptA